MGHLSTLRTISHSFLHLEVDDAEAASLTPWTGHVRYTPKYGGRKTTAESWALELAPKSALAAGVNSVRGRERERFSLSGGEVVVYDCEDPADARWVAWLGPWHMAHGLFYAPEWESSDIVDTFSRVTWVDTPEGLTADGGSRFDVSMEFYATWIAGVGTMMVESKQAGVSRIPNWRGYAASSGELWRMPAPPSGEETPFLLVTETAIATLYPWDAPSDGKASVSARAAAGSAETAAGFLSKVKRVEWQA
ncbi:hypothetical protein ETD86_04645 [Nonomuraea turkmeniaca]|uniref:Uncharacterized protein n=1 Tax=Nonomuraea turkmeniaca TaxID=103838 RepID=A0A5S4FUW8_9ACTN|nr:hypothetical protein [Nonomuraea turkmeniaca]TMR24423.1 hypothetical protein ETD86_04645 [Nonomuraea turkmeniaca]